MITKECCACQENKTLDEFHRNKNGKHGRTAKCKDCVRDYTKEYNERRDAEEKRSYMAEWHAANRGRRYGCGPRTYQALVDEANGHCAICDQVPNERLVVDHDHATGVVRELLCRRCNAALGAFNDDPSLLEKAARYIRDHTESPRVVLDEPRRHSIRPRTYATECINGHLLKGDNAAARKECPGAQCVSCRRASKAKYKARGDFDFLAYADVRYRRLTGLEPNLSAPGRSPKEAPHAR